MQVSFVVGLFSTTGLQSLALPSVQELLLDELLSPPPPHAAHRVMAIIRMTNRMLRDMVTPHVWDVTRKGQ